MALFSDVEPLPETRDHLFVECSSCLRETPVSPIGLAKAAFPFSIHLPFLRAFSSYMRCPACGRRAWVRVRFKA